MKRILAWLRSLFVEPTDPMVLEQFRLAGYREGPPGYFVRDWGGKMSRISKYQGAGASWLVMISDYRGTLIGPVRPFSDVRDAIEYAKGMVGFDS